MAIRGLILARVKFSKSEPVIPALPACRGRRGGSGWRLVSIHHGGEETRRHGENQKALDSNSKRSSASLRVSVPPCSPWWIETNPYKHEPSTNENGFRLGAYRQGGGSPISPRTRFVHQPGSADMSVPGALPVRPSRLEYHRGPTPGDAAQAGCARACRSAGASARKALVHNVKIIFADRGFCRVDESNCAHHVVALELRAKSI